MHQAREMMFGFRDHFSYAECLGCGSLRLMDPPAEMSRYYPSTYYSQNSGEASLAKGVRAQVRKHVNRFRMTAKPIGAFLQRLHPEQDFQALAAFDLARGKSLLDVGCGSGVYLRKLREAGVQAVGVDPFVGADIKDEFGIRVFCRHLADLPGTWDNIRMHHSLEHIQNQLGTLQLIKDRLASTGRCLITLPLVSAAWRQYGVNWVQLDAPRHMFLHTERSMRSLARKAGLFVKSVTYNSTEFQFWGSELYRRDIALNDGKKLNLFTPEQMAGYRRRAEQLNSERLGDQATFEIVHLKAQRSA